MWEVFARSSIEHFSVALIGLEHEGWEWGELTAELLEIASSTQQF